MHRVRFVQQIDDHHDVVKKKMKGRLSFQGHLQHLLTIRQRLVDSKQKRDQIENLFSLNTTFNSREWQK
jgi:hypothetical protein